jgi:hypothetical protein
MSGANAYDTTNPGSAVSNREDLEQGVYLIDPDSSPMWSALNKEQCDNAQVEWSVDKYDPVDTTQIAEGEDAVAFDNEYEQLERVFNYIGITQKKFLVTDVQEMSDSAAGANYAGSAMKALKELNRNSEAITLGQQVRGISGATRTAEGVAAQLSSNTNIFSDEYKIPTAQEVTNTAPTESAVDDVLQSISDESGKLKRMRVFAGSSWLKAFAANTMRLTSTTDNFRTRVNINGQEGTIVNKIRIYEGQHGSIEVQDLNTETLYDKVDKDMAYFMDLEYASIKEMGGLVQKELPDLGGGRRAVFKRYFAPAIKNPKAHAYWDGITA